MERSFSFEDFKEVLSESLGLDTSRLDRETSFINDLGVDSLSLVNLVVRIEKQYGVKVNLGNVWSLSSVGEAYDMFIKEMDSPPEILH